MNNTWCKVIQILSCYILSCLIEVMECSKGWTFAQNIPMLVCELERANVLSAIITEDNSGQFSENQECGTHSAVLQCSYLLFLEFSLIQTFLIAIFFLICLRPYLNQSKTNIIPWWLLHYVHAVALWYMQLSTALGNVQPDNRPVLPQKTTAGQNQKS